MANGCVSITDFKRLEHKVNRLLSIHALDSSLSDEEKALVREAKEDIKGKKQGAFASINRI